MSKCRHNRVARRKSRRPKDQTTVARRKSMRKKQSRNSWCVAV